MFVQRTSILMAPHQAENRGTKNYKTKKKKINLLVDCRKWSDDESPAQALREEERTFKRAGNH